jgi:hypothetical protein
MCNVPVCMHSLFAWTICTPSNLMNLSCWSKIWNLFCNDMLTQTFYCQMFECIYDMIVVQVQTMLCILGLLSTHAFIATP